MRKKDNFLCKGFSLPRQVALGTALQVPPEDPPRDGAQPGDVRQGGRSPPGPFKTMGNSAVVFTNASRHMQD